MNLFKFDSGLAVKPLLYVVLLYGLFASLFSLSKETLQYSEPFFLIGSRMTFAGILLLAHQFIFNRRSFSFKVVHLYWLFVLGFFNIYLTNVAEIWGIQHMQSAKACLIYSLSPFVAALVAYIVLRETLDKQKWFGLCIGFLGLIPIVFAQSPTEIIAGKLFFISFAELALLIAVFCSVYGWVILKKVVNQYQYSPLMANGVSMLAGGMLALIHSYLVGEAWDPFPVMDLEPFIINTLWMCLISNIICYNLYGYLLRYFSATFMSFAGLITPFFAAFFGWLFLNETITWHYYVSIMIFSFGLFIFYQQELKQERLLLNPEPIIESN